jgi:hypothetical protein
MLRAQWRAGRRLHEWHKQGRKLLADLLAGGLITFLESIFLDHVRAGFELPVKLAVRAKVKTGFLEDPHLHDRGSGDVAVRKLLQVSFRGVLQQGRKNKCDQQEEQAAQ